MKPTEILENFGTLIKNNYGDIIIILVFNFFVALFIYHMYIKNYWDKFRLEIGLHKREIINNVIINFVVTALAFIISYIISLIIITCTLISVEGDAIIINVELVTLSTFLILTSLLGTFFSVPETIKKRETNSFEETNKNLTKTLEYLNIIVVALFKGLAQLEVIWYKYKISKYISEWENGFTGYNISNEVKADDDNNDIKGNYKILNVILFLDNNWFHQFIDETKHEKFQSETREIIYNFLEHQENLNRYTIKMHNFEGLKNFFKETLIKDFDLPYIKVIHILKQIDLNVNEARPTKNFTKDFYKENTEVTYDYTEINELKEIEFVSFK